MSISLKYQGAVNLDGKAWPPLCKHLRDGCCYNYVTAPATSVQKKGGSLYVPVKPLGWFADLHAVLRVAHVVGAMTYQRFSAPSACA
jgi:hypothetical protein